MCLHGNLKKKFDVDKLEVCAGGGDKKQDEHSWRKPALVWFHRPNGHRLRIAVK